MKVLERIPLSDITYYRIGGKARYVLQCEQQEDVIEALHFVRRQNISRVIILGLGANILLPDSDFDGAIVLLRGTGEQVSKKGESILTVFAGETVDTLIKASFKEHLLGLAWAGGLPSSVGGAIRGNAGAFGSEIKDTIESVTVIDLTDPAYSVRTVSKEEADFSYRSSYFKKNPHLLIVGGTFRLTPGSEQEMAEAKAVYEANIAYRKKNHPVEYPSCGSVFKNITNKEEVEKILSVWPDVRELSENKWHQKVSMGYLINRLGFSGKELGGAQVSTKHTNYIINKDHATSADVRGLIETVQQKFKETFGFIPEPEVMIVQDYA